MPPITRSICCFVRQAGLAAMSAVSALVAGEPRWALILGGGLIAVGVAHGILEEVFWIRALSHSSRHQRWLLQQGLKVSRTRQLAADADKASHRVISARAGQPTWQRHED